MVNIFICDIIKFVALFSFGFFNAIDFFKNYLRIRPFYEMIKLEEYLRICSQKTLIRNKRFKKAKNPKFSIITPILNKRNTLNRYFNSIQNQQFNDLEIIIIDDHSTDDTLKLSEELKKEDERIILIKNKRRKGTLICRNLGVFISKGKFLLFVDPDDLISKNIILHKIN